MSTSSICYLDQHQTEWLRLYWNYYPDIGLDAAVFYNLLVHDQVSLAEDTFYPDHTAKGKWAEEFKFFMNQEKVRLVSKREIYGGPLQTTKMIRSTRLYGLSDEDYLDVLNFLYCVRNHARRATQKIGNYVWCYQYRFFLGTFQ